MSAVLFVDLLGVKSRWRRGGVELVSSAYEVLESLVESALVTAQAEPSDGGIESDAAALTFVRTADSVRVGRELFRAAFLRSIQAPEQRIWLRGTIAPADPEVSLVLDTPISQDFPAVLVRRYSPDLLRAINIEQSGTKGLRLLVDNTLVDSSLNHELKIRIGQRFLVPLRTLSNSLYPDIPAGAEKPFSDLLWMVPDPLNHFDEWAIREREIGRLMRTAGRNTEEFAHIAATALMFSETGAIIRSLGRRRDGLPGSAGL